jgi:hypothetical protein
VADRDACRGARAGGGESAAGAVPREAVEAVSPRFGLMAGYDLFDGIGDLLGRKVLNYAVRAVG